MCYIIGMARIQSSLPPNIANSNKISNRIWAPVIPYVVIGIGLLVFRNAWITIVGYHLSMEIILFFGGSKFSFKQIHKSRNYRIILATAVIGGTGGLLLLFLWPLLSIPKDINSYLQNIGLTPVMWPYFITYFVLINPWLEEYYWRGYLGSGSKQIILNDLLFSGYHVLVLVGKIDGIWLIIVFLVLSLVAWFWRQANRWTEGLTASIISHITADASVILTIYFMTSRM
jgi:hypothetical protein